MTITGLAKARLAIIPLVLVAAIFATFDAGAHIWREINPDWALRFHPHDSAALAAQSDQKMIENAGKGTDAKRFGRLARIALRSDPLNARALRQLGLANQEAGQAGISVQLMSLAQRVSRRDFGTQAWWIEHFVARDDIAGALDHYDIALSCNPEGRKLLFPVLIQALDDPEIRKSFSKFVKLRRPWFRDFLEQAVETSRHPENLAEMIMRSGGLPHENDYRVLETRLLWQLAAYSQNLVAREFYLALPDGDSAMLNDMSITSSTANQRFGPLTWAFSDETDVSAMLDDNGHLWIRAASGKSAVAIQRTIYLPAGAHIFTQTLALPAGQMGAKTRWELLCQRPGGSDRIWQQEFTADSGPKTYSVPITVPVGCAAQTLKLIASGNEQPQDAEVLISQLTVR
jgi:hypothetical protein